jgi:hypothetical protein
VDIIEPKMPPLVMVKVPPLISGIESFPFRAFSDNEATCFSISAKLKLSTFRTTGTINPLGVLTATEISV